LTVLKKKALPVGLDGYGPEKKGRLLAAVTFDDAFQCVLHNAVPELLLRHIPFAVFVPTGYCGKMQGWTDELRYRGPILSVAEIKGIPRELLTIGAHGVTHAKLTSLDKESAEKEIAGSLHFLGKNLGMAVTNFAFPHGFYTADHLEMLTRNGVKKAFRTIPVFCAADTDDNFVYGRITVSPDDWKLEYTLKILGAYQWLPVGIMIKTKLRHFMKAITPRNGVREIPDCREL
jgi:peptidoglycan/xylan/chitin deacetylase (PgdA/CDA1 family)